ncbi:helix-turn-helix domain-containing protein [Streptomyces sp. NPDC047928]|uniref:helix-turn-helix domain-containing protein n=1 Tax=unclassified Streptomyces TaxID=2593676 RepID=UPI00370FD3C5
MPSGIPRQQTRQCSNCGKEYKHTVRPGRPKAFCSTACKAAARGSSTEPPDHTQHDEDLRATTEDLHLAVTTLLTTVQDGGTSANLMRQVTDLQRLLQNVEAAVVGRGRARGDSWDDICRSTGRGTERMRKKWTQDAITRRLDLVRATRATGSVPAPDSSNGSHDQRAGTPCTATTDPADGAARPPSQTPAQQLAAAMSFLQRATRKSIKETALDMGVSPSHVSRILSGTRRPSWPVVQRFAAACHASHHELRDLWEAAQRPPAPDTPAREPAPLDPAKAKEKFHTSLRALYLAAGRPDLWTIQHATSPRTHLPIRKISRALSGGDIPDWDTAARIILALHGRPAELRPLWQAATTPPRDTRLHRPDTSS